MLLTKKILKLTLVDLLHLKFCVLLKVEMKYAIYKSADGVIKDFDYLSFKLF